MSTMVITVIVAALVFDFTNGFHDTANAMATSIATGALRPRTAVLLAGVLNLIGAFLSGQVAKTISGGLVDQARITPLVIFCGLVGAILWNLLTWLLSLPSSSTHALFGGLIGATWVFAGPAAIQFSSVLGKVLVPLLISPVIAGLLALIVTRVINRITARREGQAVSRFFRHAQVVSASTVALAHGTNDAQKTMGIITLALITVGLLPSGSAPPLWVIIVCGLAIASGTAIGGWRIIRTLGNRISHIETKQGFAAEASSTAIILTSANLGLALSTTQVTTGAIFGAGAARRPRNVQWGMAGRMTIAWLVTLPAAAAVGALAIWIASSSPAGPVLVTALLVVAATVIFLVSRRKPVTADNVNDVPEEQRVPVAAGAN